jgi:hypothetical protein
VIGNGALKSAILSDGVISVPSLDNYESLTIKVCEALVAARRLFGRTSVLKLDDDCVRRGETDTASFFATVSDAEYVGESAGTLCFDRTWHIGKCEDLSPRAYGGRFRVSWARGPLYFLGSDAVNCLVTTYLKYPSDFEGSWDFEDKRIGDTLFENGFRLKVAPLWQSTGLQSDNEVPPVWP